MPWWGWLVIATIAIPLGMLAQRRGWIDLRGDGRRGGTGAGLVGIGDEVFNPTRHEAALELDRQTALPAPAPVPGDDHLGVPRIESDPDEGEGSRGSIRL